MSVTTETVIDFLLARIAEDEAVARTTSRSPFQVKAGTSREADEITVHAMRWEPERVLAECAAKRQIVALAIDGFEHNPNSTLHILAAVYADHADFREEWRS